MKLLVYYTKEYVLSIYCVSHKFSDYARSGTSGVQSNRQVERTPDDGTVLSNIYYIFSALICILHAAG